MSPCKDTKRKGILKKENRVNDNKLPKNAIPKNTLEEKYFDNIIVLNKI
jgi:hypothetical protein